MSELKLRPPKIRNHSTVFSRWDEVLDPNDAPRQPRLLPRLVDLRRLVPDDRHVFAGAGFARGDGDRTYGGGRGDHHDVFSGAGFLRVSICRVRIFAAA